MPTVDDLAKLATELYKEHPSVGAEQTIWNGITLDTSKASSLGFTGSQLNVWSGEEISIGSAFGRTFYSSSTSRGGVSRYGSAGSNGQTMCIGE